MSWRRLGRVFCPDGRLRWLRSHAANPFAEPRDDGRLRIYFSGRDAESRSSVASVNWKLGGAEAATLDDQPVLGFGAAGLFDDAGVSLGCIVTAGADRYLYYVGWNRCVSVPWRNSIGLAISRDGGPFHKQGPAPVLDRSNVDPFSLSYPWVLRDDGIWKMWYGSHLNWGRAGREFEHVIKYAESKDGILWRPTGQVCLAADSDDSYAYSRPCVVREDGRYKMWFSYRGRHYKIGYAESEDGLRWRRQRRACLGPSESGWDSEAVEYPHVFDSAGRRYMLYCGNGYGRTGFGLACLAGDES